MLFLHLSAVVISGSNLFGHADNVSRVTFGEIEAEIDYTQATDTQITVRIQSNDVASNTAVPVVITGSTMARVSSSGNDWTYLVPGSIENVQPNIGQNGTMVSITGKILRIICHSNDNIAQILCESSDLNRIVILYITLNISDLYTFNGPIRI